MSLNIAEILERQPQDLADPIAIVDARRAVTYAQLNEEAGRAAADLAGAGLRCHDRALVCCPMSVELYVILIAMFRAGVTPVFLDPSAGRAQLAACCQWLQPRGFVAVPKAHLLRVISRHVRAVPVKLAIGRCMPGARSVASGCRRPAGGAHAIVPRDADSPALITFTSGATGQAKAIVRSHGFLVKQHAALVDALALRSGTVDVTTLPVFVLANLASGVTSVIPNVDLRAPGAIDPRRLVEQLRSTAPDRITASPALLERLVEHLERKRERLHVAHVFTGGGPVFAPLLERLSAVLPGCSITAVYGSSEAEPIAHLRLGEIAACDREAMRQGAGLLVGPPVESVQVRVLPDRWGQAVGPCDPEAFEKQTTLPGEPGEIVVAGDHVVAGYLDGRGDEETKIRVGARTWHRTGDAGYLDASGRLWLLGRCSARVTDSRGTLYPLAVETAASEITGIRRSAFLQHLGRRMLVVELDSSAAAMTPDWIRRRLDWARLDDVVAVGRIPVDHRHNAKVDYLAVQRALR